VAQGGELLLAVRGLPAETGLVQAIKLRSLSLEESSGISALPRNKTAGLTGSPGRRLRSRCAV